MKANQVFLRRDEGVSPVIAVILMVAITVVLSATVYVWVSGFGAQNSTRQKTIGLISSAPLSGNTKLYSVSSAAAGMKWSDVRFTLNGRTLAYDSTLTGTAKYCVATTGSSCVATASWNPASAVQAGQTITLADTSLNGETLRVVDAEANAVILTLVVG